jgi:hypothetical protein
MGDKIAGPASVVSLALGGFSSIAQGQSNAANYRRQGQGAYLEALQGVMQSDLAARAGELRANEIGANMQQDINSTLQNIAVTRSVTNASGPSGDAVRNRFEYLADQQKARTVGGVLAQAQADRNNSLLYVVSGMRAMDAANGNANAAGLAGYLGAAGKLLGGLSSWTPPKAGGGAGQTGQIWTEALWS